MTPSVPNNESDRLRILRALSILDTAPETSFDEIAELGKQLFDVPIVLVSLVDECRQWFKSKVGVDISEGSRDESFCAHTILDDGPMVIPDTQKDPRFADNVWVKSPFNVRFYAGAPVFAGGCAMGTLCVIDSNPRELSDRQTKLLATLAHQVTVLLEDRLKSVHMSEYVEHLVSITGALEEQNGSIRESERRLESALESTRRASEDQRLAARRFEALFHGLSVAAFTFDEAGRIQEWNAAASRTFGRGPGDVIGKTIFEAFSAGKKPKRGLQVIESVLGGGTVNDVDWSYRRTDGSTVRLKSSSFPMYRNEGDVIGGVCTHVDVTQIKNQQRVLRQSEARLRTIIESLYEGLVLKDSEGRVALCNLAIEKILGLGRDEMVGGIFPDPSWTCLHEDGTPYAPDEYPDTLALRTGQPQSDVVMGLGETRETCRWLLINAVPLKGERQEKPHSVVCSFVDVTDRRKAEELIKEQVATISETALQLGLRQMELEDANRKLERLALTDVLTGISNRRAFETAVEQGLARSVRYGRAISIALVDVDLFKNFNDEFGHQAGDSVLRNVAQILLASVRDSDTVARFGGEEFAIVMPETDRMEATAACERLRRAVEIEHMRGRPLTASFGVTTLSMTLPTESTEQLIEQADRALYRSKELGRNRVTHAADLDSLAEDSLRPLG